MTEDKIGRRDFLKLAGFSALSLAARDLTRSPEMTQEHIDFNSDGVMLIDGEKFFPVVLYGLPGDPNLIESWQAAKNAGANTITMFFPTPEALDFAEELDLKTIIRLDYLFPNYQPNEAELKRVLKRKSVIAFEIDEPNEYWADQQLEGTNKTKKEALFELLKWLPPFTDMPIRVTTNGEAHLMLYPQNIDFLKELYNIYPKVILGPDMYADGVADEVSSYADFWQKEKLSNPQIIKSVWDVTGAHSEDEIYFGHHLTYDDMLYHAISGIAGGARGIGYYDNPWGTDSRGWSVDPNKNGVVNSFGEHLQDIKQINELLKIALPGLVGQEVRRLKDKNLNVRVMQTGEAGSYYIFWADNSNRTAGIQFVGPQREIA